MFYCLDRSIFHRTSFSLLHILLAGKNAILFTHLQQAHSVFLPLTSADCAHLQTFWP